MGTTTETMTTSMTTKTNGARRSRPLSRSALAARAMTLIDRLPEGSDEQREALARFAAEFHPRACRI